VVYLTASGTHFLQNATQVSFTGGILSPEVTVTSPTTAIVNVAVPAGAAIGLQNATVWTGGEIATLNNAFTVIGATPALAGSGAKFRHAGPDAERRHHRQRLYDLPGWRSIRIPPSDPVVADFTGEITVNSITVTSAKQRDSQHHRQPERQRRQHYGKAHGQQRLRRRDHLPVRLCGYAFERRHHQRDACLRSAGRPGDARRDRREHPLGARQHNGSFLSGSV
jgi:hypothetical protein